MPPIFWYDTVICPAFRQFSTVVLYCVYPTIPAPWFCLSLAAKALNDWASTLPRLMQLRIMALTAFPAIPPVPSVHSLTVPVNAQSVTTVVSACEPFTIPTMPPENFFMLLTVAAEVQFDISEPAFAWPTTVPLVVKPSTEHDESKFRLRTAPPCPSVPTKPT